MAVGGWRARLLGGRFVLCAGSWHAGVGVWLVVCVFFLRMRVSPCCLLVGVRVCVCVTGACGTVAYMAVCVCVCVCHRRAWHCRIHGGACVCVCVAVFVKGVVGSVVCVAV